jgi:hypothetical protein
LVTFVSQPFAGSPSQLPKPAAQAATSQAPCEQVAVALARAQAVPQAPQRVTVVSRFTSHPLERVPSQLPKPRVQVIAQAPAVQVVGAALAVCRTHETPQPPQFERSVWGSTQALLHTARGAVQTSRHEPAKQMAFDAQARPQAPQFARSLERFRSQPSLALLLQSAKPVLQVPRPQVPLAQVAAALANAQTRPQAPQLRTSVWVLMQALLQNDCPVGHTQRPMEQLWPVPQSRPQAPQLRTLVWRLRQPPLQLVCPVGHEVAHMPALHTRTKPQLFPQAPQLARLAWRSVHAPLQ